MKFTAHQQTVLSFCRSTIQTTGMMPTHRQISEHMGWVGTNRTSDLMNSLTALGIVRLVDPDGVPRKGVARQWEFVA